MKRLKDWAWWLVVVLVVGTPLHGLASTFLLHGLELQGLSLFVQAWKELLIGVLVVMGLVWMWRQKRGLSQWQVLIGAFGLVGLIVTLTNWSELSLGHLIWGARTEFAFFAFLFALLAFIKDWTKLQRERLIQVVIVVGGLVLAAAFLLQLVGYDTLVWLGFRNDWSTFYLGEAPAFCQREAGTEFCRWQSSFVGPNRLAAYLLILLPIFLFFVKQQWQRVLLVGSALVALIFTLSSGAWLALVLMICCGLIWYYRRQFWEQRCNVSLVVATVATVILVVWGTGGFDSLIDRAMELEHVQKPLAALELVKERPLGYGLAVAGPASYKVGADLIPESWFVQVAVNTGVIGLFLFVLILALLLQQFWKIEKFNRWKLVAGLALVGVLVQNLFLHTLEDAGVYIVLMVVVVLGLNES